MVVDSVDASVALTATLDDLRPLLFEGDHPLVDRREPSPAVIRCSEAQVNARCLEHVPNLLIGKLYQEVSQKLPALFADHRVL